MARIYDTAWVATKLVILIEHYIGKLPTWLSPVQVAVLTISENFNDYAAHLGDVFEVSFNKHLRKRPIW